MCTKKSVQNAKTSLQVLPCHSPKTLLQFHLETLVKLNYATMDNRTAYSKYDDCIEQRANGHAL